MVEKDELRIKTTKELTGNLELVASYIGSTRNQLVLDYIINGLRKDADFITKIKKLKKKG